MACIWIQDNRKNRSTYFAVGCLKKFVNTRKNRTFNLGMAENMTKCPFCHQTVKIAQQKPKA